MNKQLQNLLIELKLNIELETILAFIDGDLEKTESLKIKKIIDSNPKLLMFVNEMDLLMLIPNFYILIYFYQATIKLLKIENHLFH